MAHETSGNQNTVSNRVMELVVAAAFLAVSIVVMYDSNRVGASWAADGPEAGYFPFYIGLIMFISSAVTFVSNLVSKAGSTTFVGREELKQVMAVLVPTIVFVISIGFLGIYVAGGLFIAFFMVVLGKYPVWKVAPIAVCVPLFLFTLFEIWFLVPLPKGPLEAALGY